jgi:ubiquinone biosynthesis monooxygenase Coq7
MSDQQRRVRDALNADQVHFRTPPDDPSDTKAIKKALRALHNLEIMATNIYRYQIHSKNDDHNRLLIAAMANEMTHIQDFHIKLLEYGFRPFLFRYAYWIVGLCIGFVSKCLGSRCVLRTGIWVETKAVHHYGTLLEAAPWDDETRAVIDADRQDEIHHIDQWRKLLEP